VGYCWGSGSDYNLGNGLNTSQLNPVQVQFP
jgi:hypothetical protein